MPAGREAGLHNTNDVIERRLEELRVEVEKVLDADVVFFAGPIDDGAHAHLRDIIEATDDRRDRLALLLETTGGYAESAERMANTFRYHYPVVDFVVPTFAMSAGTVLVMSGDAIYVDYSSTLGPIDPQVATTSGQYVPALGYLEHYERLVKKSASGQLTTAELSNLIERFDPAELYQYEQARDLSIALLREWLVKYKFKNWTVTETRKKRVTQRMKEARAADIARKLNRTSLWHSHNRGITMEVLRRDLKLLIEDIADNSALKDALSNYVSMFMDFRYRLGHHYLAIDCSEGYHGHN
jgi:ClpP class serine protease